MVENWRILSTPSFSDHRYTYFSIRSKGKLRREVRRNHQKYKLGSLRADTIRLDT